jgi:hypothetical protein
MTIPPEPPPPPTTIGTQPKSADEVNGLIGTHLRGFSASKITINQDAAWLAVTDLKEAPYYFAADQEATIKSAIADLDTALDAVDMTFISRIIGI